MRERLIWIILCEIAGKNVFKHFFSNKCISIFFEYFFPNEKDTVNYIYFLFKTLLVLKSLQIIVQEVLRWLEESYAAAKEDRSEKLSSAPATTTAKQKVDECCKVCLVIVLLNLCPSDRYSSAHFSHHPELFPMFFYFLARPYPIAFLLIIFPYLLFARDMRPALIHAPRNYTVFTSPRAWG